MSRRFIIVAGVCFELGIVFAQRASLSIAVVSMSHQLKWSGDEKGMILSSFFWGYAAFMIPGGLLVQRYGGFIMLGIAVAFPSGFTALVPIASLSDLRSVYVLRILTGCCEAATFPAAFDIISRWIPFPEKSTVIGLITGSAFLGNAVGFGLTGYVCDHLNWEASFYILSLVGSFTTLFWLMFCSLDPQTDSWISESERIFISQTSHSCNSSTVKSVDLFKPLNTDESNSGQSLKVDKLEGVGTFLLEGESIWFKIVTRRHLWTVYFQEFAANWTSYTIMTELPTYLTDVLDFDLTKSGFLLIGLNLTQWFGCVFGGYSADYLISSGVLQRRTARVIYQEISLLGSACLLTLSTFQSQPLVIVVFMFSSVWFLGFNVGGHRSSYVDLAPNSSSSVYAFSNTIANISGIMTPLITSALTTGDAKDEFGWHAVFILASGISAVAGILWLATATSEPISGM